MCVTYVLELRYLLVPLLAHFVLETINVQAHSVLQIGAELLQKEDDKAAHRVS